MGRHILFGLAFGLLAALRVACPACAQNAGNPFDKPSPSRPLESWADPGLKVTRGLVLWLDAARLNAARRALGRADVPDGGRVAIWYDSSGNGRHLAQIHPEAQPLYLAGALRFNGESTFLERAGAAARLEDFTLFIVAAPFSNAGGFRAFLATHEQGEVDFTSGVTVDMSAAFTMRFDTLNVEGEGFGGMQNLLAEPSSFGTVRRMVVTSSPGPRGTKLYMDGKPARARDRKASILDVDRIVAGARYFGFPPAIQGFLDGDILQILVFDRVLSEPERKEVESYLAARTGGSGPITRPLPSKPGKPLVSVVNPPPVQMLIPGFVARELPVDLTNINNIKYRADGKLVALSYSGDINLLSDADGDGLEEKVDRFWTNNGSLVAPIGMALSPKGSRYGDGVFVASKGKVSLIVDSDGDGQADKEIIVAQGWKELPHGVDALGVALDQAGNVYFGLGTPDFTNAYEIDGSGRANYNLKNDHGTIQRVSPDFRNREIIATGIRFPVALRFNRHGDLFATDQEGATWLANGNPFDELLHIQPGRHFGFPPRHPKHLPSVIDEPSVFDFGPQHQSTCGLSFDEPASGGPIFGPARWAGDALVTGYSRGKLFRTKLVKTPSGYVAQNHLLAVLNMLAADACVSPGGDLVVAVHSGFPDWGSGPKGKGKLFKVEYRDHEVPQPVLAWAQGPQEARVAFDRPLDPRRLTDLTRSISIEYGASVRPGDRFESLRPGYEIVARQLATPRFELPVLAAQISGDLRTLLLTTTPHPEASSYAITLPDLTSPHSSKARPRDLPQVAAVDLGYDLCGVLATWRPAATGEGWTGWLPHLDLAVARALTAGSADHDRLWDVIKRPGRLTLVTALDLWHMLRPANPARLDDRLLPAGGSGIARVLEHQPARRERAIRAWPCTPRGPHRVRVTVKPKERQPARIEISLETSGHPMLEVSCTTQEDNRPRSLPLRRFLLPWAGLEKDDGGTARARPRRAEGWRLGSWTRPFLR